MKNLLPFLHPRRGQIRLNALREQFSMIPDNESMREKPGEPHCYSDFACRQAKCQAQSQEAQHPVAKNQGQGPDYKIHLFSQELDYFSFVQKLISYDLIIN
ncbi:hypothetical protein GDO78_002234 [Eleutherodactylus coqui]|uniref:Uncharacterized protein n=1 Tax=Eleutherodactylus coqui TaxID=57060 RepID=A0A8J6EXL3_ELECQ|nr:hypothetical protein GDO78_002234 [Eleutherodactylus coqui]